MSRRTRRVLLAAVAVVAAAAVAFAIGRFSAFDTSGVPNAADIGFARDMQEHHAQAVDMAMTVYRETSDEEIRAISYDIATGQSSQRGEMYDWLVQWGVSQSGQPMSWMSDAEGHEHGESTLTTEDARTLMGMASDEELSALRAATGTAADCLFLELMIRHHEGALEMTDAVLERGSVARVLQVAESMRSGQSAEIDAMQAAAERLGCAA